MAGVWHQAGCCCVVPPGEACSYCQTGTTPACVRVTVSGLTKCEGWPFGSNWLNTAYDWIDGVHVCHQSDPCHWTDSYSWWVDGLGWMVAWVHIELQSSRIIITAAARHGAFYTGSFFSGRESVVVPVNCQTKQGTILNLYDAEDCNGWASYGAVTYGGQANYKMGVACLPNILLRDCDTAVETVTSDYLDDWYFGRVLLTSASECILVVGRTSRPADIGYIPQFWNVLDSCQECDEWRS